jgi:hypothetical protein
VNGRPLTATAVVLLATGCGAGKHAAAPESRQEIGAHIAAYASCLRSHGVAASPQPDGTMLIGVSPGTGAAVQSAQRACRRALPPGGLPTPTRADLALRTKRALSAAACMRRHGVPGFPDPSPGGGFDLSSSTDGGIDPGSPLFRSAARVCGLPDA